MPMLFSYSSVYYGRTTVAEAGTPVILLSTIETNSIQIRALNTNSGFIYVGDVNVSSSNGYPLSPGESMIAEIDQSKIPLYIDADQNNNGVAYFAGKY